MARENITWLDSSVLRVLSLYSHASSLQLLPCGKCSINSQSCLPCFKKTDITNMHKIITNNLNCLIKCLSINELFYKRNVQMLSTRLPSSVPFILFLGLEGPLDQNILSMKTTQPHSSPSYDFRAKLDPFLYINKATCLISI